MTSTPAVATPTTPSDQSADLKSHLTVVTVPTTAAQGGVTATGVQVIAQGGTSWPSVISPITYIPTSLPGGAAAILSPQILSTAAASRVPILTTPIIGLSPGGGVPQLFTLGQGPTVPSTLPMIRVAIPQMTSASGKPDETS